jgi:hypothetical protein
MTRRHIAAAAGLLALAPLMTACLVGPGTPGSGPGGMFDNVCEIILVPADSGLQPGSPTSGLITGQIELNCSAVPSSQHVTLSLSADEGGGMVPNLKTASYDGPQDSYTVTANCVSGRWLLSYSVTATVNGASGDKQGTSAIQTITAKDCQP